MEEEEENLEEDDEDEKEEGVRSNICDGPTCFLRSSSPTRSWMGRYPSASGEGLVHLMRRN